MTFAQELCALINKYSLENGSDTPDFILAEYLEQCLTTFEWAVDKRKRWYKSELENDKSSKQNLDSTEDKNE